MKGFESNSGPRCTLLLTIATHFMHMYELKMLHCTGTGEYKYSSVNMYFLKEYCLYVELHGHECVDYFSFGVHMFC